MTKESLTDITEIYSDAEKAWLSANWEYARSIIRRNQVVQGDMVERVGDAIHEAWHTAGTTIDEIAKAAIAAINMGAVVPNGILSREEDTLLQNALEIIEQYDKIENAYIDRKILLCKEIYDTLDAPTFIDPIVNCRNLTASLQRIEKILTSPLFPEPTGEDTQKTCPAPASDIHHPHCVHGNMPDEQCSYCLHSIMGRNPVQSEAERHNSEPSGSGVESPSRLGDALNIEPPPANQQREILLPTSFDEVFQRAWDCWYGLYRGNMNVEQMARLFGKMKELLAWKLVLMQSIEPMQNPSSNPSKRKAWR